MRALVFAVSMICLFLIASSAAAQTGNDDQYVNKELEQAEQPSTYVNEELQQSQYQGPPKVVIPPGMQMYNLNGINMIAPAGTRFTKQGAQMIMESSDEFMSRNFRDMHERINTLESQQSQLQKQLDDLKKTVSSLQK